MQVLNTFREGFSYSNKQYGWLLPMIIPSFIWYMAIVGALKTNGLMATPFEKKDAVSKTTSYAQRLQEFPGNPVVTVHEDYDGNRESRLVVRAMESRSVISDPLLSFILPGYCAILFALFTAGAALFLASPSHHLVSKIEVVLMFGNTGAILWLFGPEAVSKLAEFIKV